MKIDYKKYPILECLSKGSLGRMPVFESDKQSFDIFMSTFVEKWKTGVLKFKKEINIVSNPFFEASEKSKVKLAELYSDIIVNDLADFEIQGTYCVGDLVIMIDYDIRQGYEDFDLLIFVFTISTGNFFSSFFATVF